MGGPGGGVSQVNAALSAIGRYGGGYSSYTVLQIAVEWVMVTTTSRSAGRGLFWKGVVCFSQSKPREPRDVNLITTPFELLESFKVQHLEEPRKPRKPRDEKFEDPPIQTAPLCRGPKTPPPKSRNTTKNTAFTRTFSKVRTNFCLLPCSM